MPSNRIEFGDFKLELNARPDRLDLRDRAYNPPLMPLAREFPSQDEVDKYLPYYEHLILDQGKQGACTGFGLAAVINYQFWFRDEVLQEGTDLPLSAIAPGKRKQAAAKRLVSARMLYQMARLYDEWDGEDYAGSSCRGAMRGWHHHGVCLEQTWPYENAGALFEDHDNPDDRNEWLHDAAARPLGAYYRISSSSISDMQAAIQQVHAIFVSANVHEGWTSPAVAKYRPPSNVAYKVPHIPWDGSQEPLGGHAFAIVGYTRDGFTVQNSWGKRWGNRGFAVLSYEDWQRNGIDAWASVYGAPTAMECPPKTKSKGSLQHSAERGKKSAETENAKTDEEKQRDRLRPWTDNVATLHSVVMGNNGRAMSRLVHAENGAEHLLICAEKRILRWCRERRNNDHVVIYAHGGLKSEAETLRRSAILGPWFKENGIYPLFLSWTSGVLDDLGTLFRDAVGAQKQRASGGSLTPSELDRQIRETNDYTWEAMASGVSIRPVWTELKENAALAGQDGGCLELLAGHLRHLCDKYDELRIHLMGHSAGAYVIGHLLNQLTEKGVRAESTTLWAPACSMRFAHQIFGGAFKSGHLDRDRFSVEILDEGLERVDGVAGLYTQSFLHLVSRALERTHKTPLLGLQNSWVGEGNALAKLPDAKAWHDVYSGLPKIIRNPVTIAKDDGMDQFPHQITMKHCSFDQSIWTLQAAIEDMLAPETPAYDVNNLCDR